MEHKSPQIHHQADAVRGFLFGVSILMFVVTTILLLLRVKATSSDLSLLAPLPFIGLISVIPMIMPTELTFLEAIGTARILVTAHPFASFKTRKVGVAGPDGLISEVVTSNRPRLYLFLRYCLAILRSRFFPEESLLGSSPSASSSLITRLLDQIFQRLALSSADLIPTPAVNLCFLEKMGVTTAFCIIDDDLACEPRSTPQQLLIPSGHGLKLLDLCPNFENESEMESQEGRGGNTAYGRASRKHTNSVNSSLHSDSDSDDEQLTGASANAIANENENSNISTQSLKASTFNVLRRKWRKGSKRGASKKGLNLSNPNLRNDSEAESDKLENEVQFEDPNWWKFLPSLKCIGLTCLLTRADESTLHEIEESNEAASSSDVSDSSRLSCEKALLRHITQHQNRSQLLALAQCIGFETKLNSFGPRGDISPFDEIRRLHVISSKLLSKRLDIDRHALGVEDAKLWGHLRNDAICVIVQDKRSQGLQLLTVGNPSVVAELCTDSWHGENSTISPLTTVDRKSILDTSNNWNLSDLDVVAFSYSPVPYTLEQRFLFATSEAHGTSSDVYLVDNKPSENMDATVKDTSSDWLLVNNQIFLGMLGSLVSPREEIDYILRNLTQAGVRFVYFSPRNMRRTKELASQMGIDVAWNCAISLRALHDGEEDPHRMVSTYADWDVNAKLPHGIEDVRRHLQEVDNVPLLVSLFTDVTEDSTTEMVSYLQIVWQTDKYVQLLTKFLCQINIFREYHDTVIAVGLSHLSANEGPFRAADIAIGVDVLLPSQKFISTIDQSSPSNSGESGNEGSIDHRWCAVGIDEPSLHFHEVEFVSSMVAHNCAFILKGTWSMEFLPDIIATGRAALDATTSGALFVVYGGLSLGFLVVLCPCTVAAAIPYIPALGVIAYLLLVLPVIGLTMSWTDAQEDSMSSVPPKNDESIVFGRGDGRRLYFNLLLRAFLPAVGAQFLYLIALGELLAKVESSFMEKECDMPPLSQGGYSILGGGSNWIHAIRCPALRYYSGVARIWAGTLMLVHLMVCVVLCSAGFVYRFRSLHEEPPWHRNYCWFYSSTIFLLVIAIYAVVSMNGGRSAPVVARALPWYFYLLFVVFPLLWIAAGEVIKFYHQRHEKRSRTLRRLQFETKLGMWSPK